MELYIYITNETIYPTSPDNLASNAVAWLLHETQPSVAPLPLPPRGGKHTQGIFEAGQGIAPWWPLPANKRWCAADFLQKLSLFTNFLKKSNFLASQTFLHHRDQHFQKTFSTTCDQ